MSNRHISYKGTCSHCLKAHTMPIYRPQAKQMYQKVNQVVGFNFEKKYLLTAYYGLLEATVK
jgi:hypothetical protein